jgi:hypothetical protein
VSRKVAVVAAEAEPERRWRENAATVRIERATEDRSDD